MPQPTLEILKIHNNAITPTKGTPQSAGYDLYAVEDDIILQGKTTLVRTGLKIALRSKDTTRHYIQIFPRSSMSKKGITVEAGVIDVDYRGELMVMLHNNGADSYNIKSGDKIAQLIILNREEPIISEVSSLDQTVRGEGGFGSTGK